MIRRGWTDEEMDQRIGNLLRTGVLLSALIALAGGILMIYQEGSSKPHDQVFSGEPGPLRSFLGTLEDAARLDANGVIQFGIILLVLTPVARVAFSVFAFWRARDWTYVIITLVVLMILLATMLVWHHEKI
jgi:uncharacterized membrane protein